MHSLNNYYKYFFSSDAIYFILIIFSGCLSWAPILSWILEVKLEWYKEEETLVYNIGVRKLLLNSLCNLRRGIGIRGIGSSTRIQHAHKRKCELKTGFTHFTLLYLVYHCISQAWLVLFITGTKSSKSDSALHTYQAQKGQLAAARDQGREVDQRLNAASRAHTALGNRQTYRYQSPSYQLSILLCHIDDACGAFIENRLIDWLVVDKNKVCLELQSNGAFRLDFKPVIFLNGYFPFPIVAVSCGYGTCFAVKTCDELYHFIFSIDRVGIPFQVHSPYVP